MPEVNKYSFTYKEIAELLVKQAGLHEDKWQIILSFGLSAANIGPNEDQVVPAAIVGATAIGLQRATPESPPALTVDAAEVNPPLKRGKKA